MDILINHDHRPELTERLPLERLARLVLEREGLPAGTEVSVTFVDDEEIARLNEEFRGKEGPTDVLSFECDGVDDDLGFPDAVEDAPFELGDVVIAPDVVERQADGFGNTFDQELFVMLVHGLLHLCGHDHIEDDDAAEMAARQRELLEAWYEESGLPRPAVVYAEIVEGEH